MRPQRHHTILLALTGLVLMATTVDLDHLYNYAQQELPAHITAGADMPDSAPPDNPMNDAVATLGRVLFHDRRLSSDHTVSCSTCHLQAYAFSIPGPQGQGVNGLTPRRPLRLVNLHTMPPGIGLFWDERAPDLESLVTEPIHDHLEMGFSGQDGAPGIDVLLADLSNREHYQRLFTFAFGDATVTEERMAKALAQFVRSIRSYDSRFDAGLIATGNDIEADFPNFSAAENAGKTLFVTDPWGMQFERIGGGAGCFRCHGTEPRTLNFVPVEAPGNNGIITEIDGSEVLNITRSASMRDLFGPGGFINGAMFHNAQAGTVAEMMDHYDSIPSNPLLDVRQNILRTRMHFSEEEKEQMDAFLRTLTGTALYTDPKWSDPFQSDGSIEVIGGSAGMAPFIGSDAVRPYPNPTTDQLYIDGLGPGPQLVSVFDRQGKFLFRRPVRSGQAMDVSSLAAGIYLLEVGTPAVRRTFVKH